MTEPRAQEGIDHLQHAALELIAAARAFLDVAEDVVTDRDRFTDAAGTVSDLLGSVMGAVRGGGTSDEPGDGEDPAGPSAPWASILDPEPVDRSDDGRGSDGHRHGRRVGLEIVADLSPDEPTSSTPDAPDRAPGPAERDTARRGPTKARVRRIAVD